MPLAEGYVGRALNYWTVITYYHCEHAAWLCKYVVKNIVCEMLYMDLCFGRFSKLKTYFEIRTPVIGLSLSEWYSARINVWFSRYKKRYEMLTALL